MSSEKEVSGSSGAVSTTGSPLHESEWTPPCEQLSAPGRDELVTLRRPPRRVQEGETPFNIGGLLEENAALKKLVADLKEELAIQVATVQAYKEDFEAERKDREHLRSKMVDQNELTQSKGQKTKEAHVRSHSKQLERQRSAKDTQLSKLQSEIERLKSAHQQNTKELENGKNTKIRELEGALEDKISLQRALEDQLKQLLEALNRSREQESDRSSQIKELKDTNKQNEEKLAAKESELKSAKEELERKDEDCKFETKRCEEMAEELKHLKQALADHGQLQPTLIQAPDLQQEGRKLAVSSPLLAT